MINKDLIAIFDYMEREKGVKREKIIQAIEDSLYAAANKSLSWDKEIQVSIDPKTGNIEVTTQKKVVEKVTDPKQEISLEEAKEISTKHRLGQLIGVIVTPKDFGRIAAQAARHVITQKLRSAERDVIHEEYKHRINELISGAVKSRQQGANLIIDLGKIDAILPMKNYPKTERYRTGERVLALLLAVEENEKGRTEIVLSRSHVEFVKQLFMQEVPELNDGTVIFKKIVREPGYRTKIAVESTNLKVDPVGACVGVRGNRIKNVIQELNNEKIDVINYSNDTVELLQAALSPIEIKKIRINEGKISIIVDDEDIPMVVGKGGLNASLNGRLIDMQLDVQSSSDYKRELAKERIILVNSEDPILEEKFSPSNLNRLIIDTLHEHGYTTYKKILSSSPEELTEISGISIEMANDVLEQTLQSIYEMQQEK